MSEQALGHWLNNLVNFLWGPPMVVLMAGGGIKPGIVHGETDDFSCNIVKDPVHISDLNATIMHCLAIAHRKLSVPFQGLDVRVTGVDDRSPVKELLV